MQFNKKVVQAKRGFLFFRKKDIMDQVEIDSRIEEKLDEVLLKKFYGLRDGHEREFPYVIIDMNAEENSKKLKYIKERIEYLCQKGLPIDFLLEKVFSQIQIDHYDYYDAKILEGWDATLKIKVENAEAFLKKWFLYAKLQKEYKQSLKLVPVPQ